MSATAEREMKALVCRGCQAPFQVAVRRGRYPNHCPDCRSEAQMRTVRERDGRPSPERPLAEPSRAQAPVAPPPGRIHEPSSGIRYELVGPHRARPAHADLVAMRCVSDGSLGERWEEAAHEGEDTVLYWRAG